MAQKTVTPQAAPPEFKEGQLVIPDDEVNEWQVAKKLELGVIGLIRDRHRPFFAKFVSRMARAADPKVKTMGVCLKNGRVYLHYNPKFVNMLDHDTLTAIFEHEVLHLVYKHMFREGNRDHNVWNIACDISINQLITGLPDWVCTRQKYNLAADLPPEAYYNQLIKLKKADGDNWGPGGQGGTIDDHGDWTPGGGGKDGGWSLEKEVVKKLVEEAQEAQSKAGRGHLPGSMEAMIEDWLRPPEIPWERQLRQAVGQSIKCGHYRSWKRPSRRLGDLVKGKVSDRTVKMAIAVDTSGSVSDEDFKLFLSEMRGIQQCYKNDITILECDADIQKTYKLTPYAKPDPKFQGRCGTSFDPIFVELKEKYELKPDLLIYFTDLECTYPVDRPHFNVIWVCTPDGAQDNLPPWGKLINMKRKKATEDVKDTSSSRFIM